MQEQLREIVLESDTRKGRVFDLFIQFLIISSLVAFAFETVPGLSEGTYLFLKYFEYFCIFIFTIEYFLRLYLTRPTIKYAFSFFGIIDLLAILPFYLTTAFDLRMLRSFRIFRVFRMFKLVRYNRAFRRFHIAAGIVKEELVLFLMVTMILVYFTSSGIYYFEHEAQPEHFSSVIDSFWWSIVTLTTVGYGDVYPITMGGRVFTFFVVLIGVGIVTVPAGLVASALSKARRVQDEEEDIETE